jgi:hypothetical protein
MLLRGELVNFARDVLRLAKVPLDDGQFAALVSFAFNCGSGNLGGSTLLRQLNEGDYVGAADQFLRWNKARRNGALVELPGLTRRRRAERALFLGEDWRAASVLRTRGGLPVARTMAPERPEPPPDQDDGSPVAAEAAMKPRRTPKAASRAPAEAARKPAGNPAGAPVRKPAKKAVEKAPVAAKSSKSAGSAKPRARTTTPKAPSKAPPARRPAPRTKR